MSTHSDGEDSAMHDNVSLSSTPSTPPPTIAGATSPPSSQQQQQLPQYNHSTTGAQQTGGVPAWAGRRATEEAESAKDRCLDRSWNLRWLGDPLDESDMWKH